MSKRWIGEPPSCQRASCMNCFLLRQLKLTSVDPRTQRITADRDLGPHEAGLGLQLANNDKRAFAQSGLCTLCKVLSNITDQSSVFENLFAYIYCCTLVWNLYKVCRLSQQVCEMVIKQFLVCVFSIEHGKTQQVVNHLYGRKKSLSIRSLHFLDRMENCNFIKYFSLVSNIVFTMVVHITVKKLRGHISRDYKTFEVIILEIFWH